jgi:hypothetical protein
VQLQQRQNRSPPLLHWRPGLATSLMATSLEVVLKGKPSQLEGRPRRFKRQQHISLGLALIPRQKWRFQAMGTSGRSALQSGQVRSP